jgi:hypothetical protein
MSKVKRFVLLSKEEYDAFLEYKKTRSVLDQQSSQNLLIQEPQEPLKESKPSKLKDEPSAGNKNCYY